MRVRGSPVRQELLSREPRNDVVTAEVRLGAGSLTASVWTDLCSSACAGTGTLRAGPSGDEGTGSRVPGPASRPSEGKKSRGSRVSQAQGLSVRGNLITRFHQDRR